MRLIGLVLKCFLQCQFLRRRGLKLSKLLLLLKHDELPLLLLKDGKMLDRLCGWQAGRQHLQVLLTRRNER